MAAVVVAFNSVELLRENLAKNPLPGVAIVVVDNSTIQLERDATELLAQAEGWLYIAMSENVGFGSASNAGAEAAIDRGCSHVLLLNPDASIRADSLDQLIEQADDDTILSPLILRPDGKVWFRGGELDVSKGVARHAAAPVDPVWLTGACMLVPARAWSNLGGFDSRYFLYWEDVDLSFRWRASGGGLRVVETATALHDAGGTQGLEDEKSPTYFRYNCRNRILFGFLNLRTSSALWWFISSPRYWRRMLRSANVQPGRRGAALSASIRGTTAGLIAGLRARKQK
ncbi:glycosyltransferase [Agromyces atrinae]|uniref:GT2 family glycosyltransferase n=1 Tax=Agromyces atrinae TaxID=592376 RepID=A0A852SL52_9MICO|nr:glycosyltransferase family 2 protein [Agromyces atrinae]NYD68509.1 GT2 family glycosyltransferase [Agromyces atrinae]